ncbi:conserved hypothetical protein, partial [Ricinus communis]
PAGGRHEAGLGTARRPLQAARDADGVQDRPLPERPAVPLQERAAAGGDSGHRVEPHGLLPAGGQLQHPVPPPAAGHRRAAGGQAGAGSQDHRADEHPPDRPGGAGALHADFVAGAVRGAEGQGDQHPPLVPAELQGRQAVRAGAPARRQADRRHRALRHRRPGRGADHRTGRRARRPLDGCRDLVGDRPRRRVRGAGARGQVVCRAPHFAERRQDRRIQVIQEIQMALKATIYKAELSIADMDRNYYDTHQLTLARHPSETDERMMVRLLAFAIHANEALSFTKGMFDVEEPDLWQKDLTGAIELSIEVGQPDEKVILKACGRSEHVVVYSYAATSHIWWKGLANKVERCKNLTVVDLDAAATEQLAGMAQRTMQLQCTIQDGQIWLTDGATTVEITRQVLKAER